MNDVPAELIMPGDVMYKLAHVRPLAIELEVRGKAREAESVKLRKEYLRTAGDCKTFDLKRLKLSTSGGAPLMPLGHHDFCEKVYFRVQGLG